jgi:hypothetical protein
MINALYSQRFEIMERLEAPETQTAAGKAGDFAALFGDATKTATPTALPAPSANTTSQPAVADTGIDSKLGDPDVQAWLNSYWTEQGAPGEANISYQPAQGAGSNYPANGIWGPDAIYAQALANQAGNAFAKLTGDDPVSLTSKLPGIPTRQAQDEYNQRLALENAYRLASGQPIDTTAYWSDPGSITLDGTTYTSAELGYAGPAQSSGPQPIFISDANQVAPNTYSVPGYTGTVTGIQPGRFYTLQQLQQAGLPSGQPDGQFHPGSWSETQSA